MKAQTLAGKVRLETWITPELRDKVRRWAREDGLPIGDWIEKLLQGVQR